MQLELQKGLGCNFKTLKCLTMQFGAQPHTTPTVNSQHPHKKRWTKTYLHTEKERIFFWKKTQEEG